jgi:phage terminase large subunit-like protein
MLKPSTELSEVEILKRIDRLPEKQRAELMERYRKKTSGEVEIWYCRKGRRCNGEPHEGVPYPHARGDQWPPPGVDWDTWFYMSGRGAGKTKAGGHWTRQMSKVAARIALIGRRGTDVRATMVEGPAGLIKACEAAGESYDWKPALKEFTFENGAKAFGYSGEEPESLRGPEHGAGWIDEPCHIALMEEVWSNYTLGLRSQGVPGGAKTLLTSSPLPVPWTKERIAEKGQVLTDETGEPQVDEEGNVMTAPRTILVQVPTSVNLKNLDEGYKRRVINPLRGTRKGRQELDAMLLEDVEGALWESDWLDRERFVPSDMDRLVVAVDPSGGDKKSSDLAGIVVVGRRGDRYHVFEDASALLTPEGWAKEAQRLYKKYEADYIVLERYGGDSAASVLRLSGFKGKIDQVKARRGKVLRADPVATLYEQKLVTHQTFAELADLEDQMLTWVPGVTPGSPDRIDALVWGLTQLSGKQQGETSWGVAKGSTQPAGALNRGPGSKYAQKHWRKGLAR